MTWYPPHPTSLPLLPLWKIGTLAPLSPDMEDYDVRSAASILASVKEQEARFEQLTRALEEERRNVTLQLERANLPPNTPASQPPPWQQVVMQVNGTPAPSTSDPHICLSACALAVIVFRPSLCF